MESMVENILSVLLIESDESDRAKLATALSSREYIDVAVTQVANWHEASALVFDRPFDCALLALNEEQAGINHLKDYLVSHFAKQTPVVVLLPTVNFKLGNEAIDMGAEDFFPKDHLSDFFLARCIIRAHECFLLRQKLLINAGEDRLTGLCLRPVFMDRLQTLLLQVNRYGGLVAVLLVDLVGFKIINQQCGYRVGDDVLKAVGHRLCVKLRSSDMAARYSGDEFVLFFMHFGSLEKLVELIEYRVKLINHPIDVLVDGKFSRIDVDVNVGGAIWDAKMGLTRLIHCAEQALDESKRAGQNWITIYRNGTECAVSKSAATDAVHLDPQDIL